MREKLGDKLSTAVTLHTGVLLGSRGPVTSTTGDVHPGALYLSHGIILNALCASSHLIFTTP